MLGEVSCSALGGMAARKPAGSRFALAAAVLASLCSAAQPSAAATEGRVVFLMMVKPCFLSEPLWVAYVKGQPRHQFGFLLHHDAEPEAKQRGFTGPAAQEAMVVGREVHHFEHAGGSRYSLGLAKQGLLMAIHALDKFPDAQCFVLVSDSHLPLVPFQALRRQLMRPRQDGSQDVACMNVPIVKRKVEELDAWFPAPKWSPMKMCQWFMMSRKVVARVAPRFAAAATWFERHRWGNKTYRRFKAPDEWLVAEVLSYIYSLPENQEVHVYGNDFDPKGSPTNPASSIAYLEPQADHPIISRCNCPGTVAFFDMDYECFVNFKRYAYCRKENKWRTASKLRELKKGTPVCPLLSSPYVVDHVDLGESFNKGRPTSLHPDVLTYLSRTQVYQSWANCTSPESSVHSDMKRLWRLVQLENGPVLFARKILFDAWAPETVNGTKASCGDRKATAAARFAESEWMKNGDLGASDPPPIGTGRAEYDTWGKEVRGIKYDPRTGQELAP